MTFMSARTLWSSLQSRVYIPIKSQITTLGIFQPCQECTPENLDVKKTVFKKVDGLVGADTILASSTSSMPCSTFTSDLQHKEQCVVAHPVS